MKPNSFFDLPYRLRESLLHDMDLKYDSYESSREETIAGILNGNCCSDNKYAIENAFESMTEDFLKERAQDILEGIEHEKRSLIEFVSS